MKYHTKVESIGYCSNDLSYCISLSKTLQLDSQRYSFYCFKTTCTISFNFMSFRCFIGLWTFLWFVGFCYMTDAWRRTEDDAPYIARHGYGRDHIQAAIAFSFFSIITWVCILPV